MPIARKIAEAMTRQSWIRRMFEEGERMRADGRGPVYDFSIGNPDLEPPPAFHARIRELLDHPIPGMHRYMANVGLPATRRAVADGLARETGIPYAAEQVVMTTGAGGALNVVLKALLDPGDEVIILAPYFVEYLFYIDNHGGIPVVVPHGPDFDIDVDATLAAVTPRTKAILLNSPNNPTGVVYPAETLERLAEGLRRRSAEIGRPITAVTDEPYRRILYDLDRCPSIIEHYDDSVLVMSHSKDLGLAGERIGYAAVHPRAADAAAFFGAMAFTVRTLGFVNAPALMQRCVEVLQEVQVDVGVYRRRRDTFHRGLTAAGYRMPTPGGAFYLFPEAPGGDDVAFCRRLAEHRVLVVPGSGFGTPGHFRISYAVPDAVIEGALPAFAAALRG